MDAFEDDARVFAAAQEREALGGLPLHVVAHGPEPWGMRQHHPRDVADGDRGARLALEDDRLHILGTTDVADSPYGQLLVAMLKKAAAHAPIRPAQRVADIGQRETVREETRRINLDVHFFQVPSEGHHIGNARDLEENPRDHPLEFRPRFCVGVPIAHDAELIDLTEGR